MLLSADSSSFRVLLLGHRLMDYYTVEWAFEQFQSHQGFNQDILRKIKKRFINRINFSHNVNLS